MRELMNGKSTHDIYHSGVMGSLLTSNSLKAAKKAERHKSALSLPVEKEIFLSDAEKEVKLHFCKVGLFVKIYFLRTDKAPPESSVRQATLKR